MESIDRLKDQLDSAKQEIHFYSDLYSDVDLEEIRDREDVREKVPSIGKEELLEFYQDGNFELASHDIKEGVLARPTSGTTSALAGYYRGKDEIDAHVERFKKAAGHYFDTGKDADKVMIATTFSLTPILTRQFLETDCTVSANSPFDVEKTAEVMKSMGFNTLVASPPIALKITERLHEEGYEGMEKYYFVSTGLSSLIESRIKEMYPDAQFMLQYGLAETGILMKQCEELQGSNKYHIFDDDSFFYEFVTDDGKEAEEGEIGELIVTKFHGKTPLIRYRVGDLFELEEKSCCGERVYNFVGRKEDRFKVQGVTVFKDEIEDALEPVKKHISQYQVVIDQKEEDDLPKPQIILRLEFSHDEDVEDEVRKKFSEEFQVADDYSWSRGVEMGIFAPVEIESANFEERKFRKIVDQRYD